MPGLCALVAFDTGDDATGEVAAMLAAAPHRALDGARTWSGRGVALAHQRRLLLPEDSADLQPLAADGLVLVADARIDNREELVPLLCRRGYLADGLGVPDSELVLAAYRLWGRACPGHLIGDFAFVVWDDRRRVVFAARDPMGMRALHYRSEPRRRLLLATEIKQLLAAKGVPREIHEAALVATLAGPHLPPSWTAYSGVEQLPPGHALEADAAGCRTWRFWQPDPAERFPSREPAAAAEAFRDVLAESVRSRLRATRPVGVFLSGGMDSGSVASMAGWLTERGQAPAGAVVRTYSWSFAEIPDSDERRVSDHVNRRYSFPATAVPADDSWPLARGLEHAPDEDDPYSWVYQALVERTLVRCRDDGVGTLLNGDRGDELTGDWVFDEVGLLAAGRVRAAAADLRHAGGGSAVGALAALRGALLRPRVQRYAPSVLERRSARSTLRPWPPWIPDDVARRVDLGDLIAQSRRLPAFGGTARSMRCGRAFSPQSARIAVLRERTRSRYGMGFADPYSDRRLVQLVLSLPQWVVQRRTQPKGLARAAMEGVMPHEALQQAHKTIPHGFFDRGFRERAVPVVEDLLTASSAAAHGWLDVAALRETYGQYVVTGQTDLDFWWPLTVEMWLRRWWS